MTQTSMGRKTNVNRMTNEVRTRVRGCEGREEERTQTTCICMQGKPAAPCPPANNTCKQGNGKSRKQRRQHRCHPRCTLAAMLVVTAPPAIALAPTPVARSQPCRQSQHHPRSHRPQPPLFALATPIKPSISHQTHAMTTLLRTY